MKTKEAIKKEIERLSEMVETLNVLRAVTNVKKKIGESNAVVISRLPLEEYCKKHNIDMHKPVSDMEFGYYLGAKSVLEWVLR